MEKLLQIEGVAKSFFGVSVLKGVDFDLDHGEVHVLLGENGAGKSTLMKILSGAYQLDCGSITLDGQKLDLSAYGPKTAEDLGIVTVYQNFHLIPHLSVAENLSLPSFTHGGGLISWARVDAHAREVLSRVDFKIDPRTKVRDLPVSKKQMLEIAVALSKNAKVLIMDEPTAALSRRETETLFKIIGDIKAQGIGIIYISHKLEEVKVIGDRITVLRDGVKVATVAAKDADLDKIIGLMIGKNLARDRQARAAIPDNELFRAMDLDNPNFSVPISFGVRKGEILGITGLVGSGKTELSPRRLRGGQVEQRQDVPGRAPGAHQLAQTGRPARHRLLARRSGCRRVVPQPGRQRERLPGVPLQAEGHAIQPDHGETHRVRHSSVNWDQVRQPVSAGEVSQWREQAEGCVWQMAVRRLQSAHP